MKKTLLILIFSGFLVQAIAQNFSVNLSGGLRKDYELNEKFDFRFSQRLALTPQFSAFNNNGDLFNDLDLLPGTSRRDDDNRRNSNGSSNRPPFDGRNWYFTPGVRSITSLRLSWKVEKWLRINNEYSYYWRAGRIRHVYETTVRIEPDLPNKKWRANWQTSFQHVGETRSSGFRISSGLRHRVQVEHRLNKVYAVYSSLGINSEIENDGSDWDRYRISAGVRYRVNSQQRFQASYRFQQKFNKNRSVAHGFNFSYLYIFD